ncbi:MAG: hypothetical protein U1F29_05325 [Planctomycetota bacterium]
MSLRIALAIGGLAVAASAQTSFPEVEPNDSKAASNPIGCMASGDQITGTTTGSGTAAGLTSLDSFLVQSCAAPLGIYAQSLKVTTTGVAGHTMTFRGLTQVSPGIITPGTDATFATSLATTTPPRALSYYGFGRQEQIYLQVTGTATTTLPYIVAFTRTPVTPIVAGGVFTPGLITVSSVGQTTTDTEIYVYDGALNPVPTAHNDDEGPAGPTSQSRVARTLAAGTYYVAISRYNLANDQADANADEDFLNDNVLDFPNVLANSNTTVGTLSVNFTISDGVTTTPITASTAALQEVVWVRFTVGTPPAFHAFCAGDGTLTDHTTPCPCGNNGAAGNGCANSVNASGGNLTATGTAALDNVVLNGSGMPLSVSCIYLQGTATDDVVFGDGARCTGGTLLRLRTKSNVGGASSFPDSVETVTLSQRGGVTVGSGVRRYYQTYYRNSAAAFCPPETFNVTNGWGIDW